MFKTFAGAALLCALLALPARAQDPTGAIEGTVTDTSSASVAGARVVAKHLETGLSKEAVASADGFYRLPLLPIGAYSLTVEAPQFARLVQEPVQVNVSQTVRID